jgi:hypothetical protein
MFAWIVPCALVIGLFALIFHGRWDADWEVLAEFDALTLSEQVGAVAGVATALGFVLSAVSTPLYRWLEGYNFPPGLAARLAKRQLKRKHWIVRAAESGRGWRRNLNQEELERYPINDEQVVPTQLGNAFRAFETYGKTRFNLDSQTLWNELMAVAPKYIQTEYDRARAFVDFFVALIYLDGLMGLLTLAIQLSSGFNVALSVYAALNIASCFLFYRMAILSTSYVGQTVQALVNLGRVKLAGELGLEIPPKMADEWKMWQRVTVFVYYGGCEPGSDLDIYRKKPAAPAPAGGDTADDAGEDGGE